MQMWQPVFSVRKALMSSASLADAHVPLLGQQIVVDGYSIAVPARCQCEQAGSLVLLTVSVSGAGTSAPPIGCAKCGQFYAIQGIQLDSQNRLSFAIAILSSRQDS
jgi:hypothetical protein